MLESADNKILNKDIGIISWNYDSQIEKSLHLLGAPVPQENQYIKLNGSATVKLIEDGKTETLGRNEIYDIKLFANKIESLESDISYAWDKKDGKIKLLEGITKDTNRILIIGYSFPLYNRNMDSRLFSLLSKNAAENNTLQINLVGPTKLRLEEYENSLRSILELGNWRDLANNKDYGDAKKAFTIKQSVSPEQFPIPSDLPIFGEGFK